jgi:homoserine kinase
MNIVARAPASTANLGPGFDCAAAALDLWNELHVEERANGGPWVEVTGEGADELPRDETNVALRAFALFAPPQRYRFRLVNRIPLERGLGSSAAAVAVGLTAGAAVAGKERDTDDTLVRGVALEGHADNLAAALKGGVCLSWAHESHPRAARLATDLPLAPIVVVPETRTKTAKSRSSLPYTIRHQDAASAAACAAMLGAAIAAGDAELLADALRGDCLHEPYRATAAPLLDQLRRDLPPGAVAVTLSGSGPSVVVWAEPGSAGDVAGELERRLDDARVLLLRVAASGAEAT